MASLRGDARGLHPAAGCRSGLRTTLKAVTATDTAILARLYAWTIILGDAGIINTYLLRWGIVHHPIALLFDRTGVVIGMVHVMLPYMIIVLYSAMVAIDRSLSARAMPSQDVLDVKRYCALRT